MDVFETNKLILFIAFVIPGFISLKAYELMFPSEARESEKQLVDAISYSCINYALLLWPILSIESSGIYKTSPNLYAAFYLFVLFITPISWVCALRVIRQTKFFLDSIPHPTAKPWDYVFGQRKCYWIIVTLKDGNKVAGKYAEGSFSSSAPADEQLYLEEAWNLNADGGFEIKREESAGIIILSSEISVVELFTLKSGDNDERQKTFERRIPAL